MLILISIDVQYSQNAVFSFEKFRIVKITSPQVLNTDKKKISPVKFLIPPPVGGGDLPLTLYNYLGNLAINCVFLFRLTSFYTAKL